MVLGGAGAGWNVQGRGGGREGEPEGPAQTMIRWRGVLEPLREGRGEDKEAEGWAGSGSRSRSGGGDTADSLRDAPLRKSQQCTMTSHKGMATAQNIPAKAVVLASKPHETQRKERAPKDLARASGDPLFNPLPSPSIPFSSPSPFSFTHKGKQLRIDYMPQCATRWVFYFFNGSMLPLGLCSLRVQRESKRFS